MVYDLISRAFWSRQPKGIEILSQSLFLAAPVLYTLTYSTVLVSYCTDYSKIMPISGIGQAVEYKLFISTDGAIHCSAVLTTRKVA